MNEMHEKAGRGPRRPSRVAIALGLIVLTLVAYAGVVGNDFVELDDPEYVTENPRVLSGLTPGGIVWAFTSVHAANWHPLTWISHMVDVSIGGLDPRVHHASSLIVHVAGAVFLFLALSRLSGAVWPSALTAALFGVHPLHVESVAWVAERKDVLSGLLFMLTLLAYARWAERPTRGRYAAALGLFAAGLLAKPMVVTLPFVLLLLDFWPLGRFRPSRAALVDAWRLVVEKAPFFALSAASCAATLWAQSSGAIRSLEHLPLGFRILNAIVSYAAYLGKMVWPANLAFFYPHPAEVGGGIPTTRVLVGAVVLAAASALALASWRRRPWLAVGWLWYVGTLVPVIGIVQVGLQSMADRYAYLPLVGIFLALSWEAARWSAGGGRIRRAVCGLAAAAVLVACVLVTRAQVTVWRNGETLDTHALEVTEGNYVAHNNYGIVLGKRGRLDEAMEHFREAIRIRPSYALAHSNLGSALGRLGDPARALPHLEEAVRLGPENAEGHNNLGRALADTGRLDEAVERFEEALRIRPDYGTARRNLALALAAQGKTERAIEHLAEVVRLTPGDAGAHARLGLLLSEAGRREEAAAWLREALRRDPDRLDAMERLAWILATSDDPGLRDPEEAISLARRAVERAGGRRADALDVLAAALAASGRFEEARREARTALEVAVTSGRGALAAEIRARLDAYEAERPWIER